MIAPALALLLASASPADSSAATADTSAARPRVVRLFEEIVVRSPLHDPRSSETVHVISQDALRRMPVDDLTSALALKAGVVVQGEELHVRGGRTGEFQYLLEGISLNEPARDRPLELPLAVLRGAEVIDGGLDAEYGGGLAGVIQLHTLDPGPRWQGRATWQTDARTGTHYDRVSGAAGGPLGIGGLGAVLGAEASLDDTHLPSLRTNGRQQILGASFGWRADNRLLGYAKLAPVAGSLRPTIELSASRIVDEPYDPMFSLDGYTTDCYGDSCTQGVHYSPTPAPGHSRYIAADHSVMTDERRVAAVASLAALSPTRRLEIAFGWQRLHSVTSLNGQDDDSYVAKSRLPEFGLYDSPWSEPFYIYLGDEPFFRRRESDTYTLRGSGERTWESGSRVAAGLGAHYDEVALRELDGTTWGTGYDSLRAYHAYAPGGFAFAQGRWFHEGIVVNAGLRVEYFTAGPQAATQAYGTPAHAIWSLSPRLGVAYPISVNDVFSLAYVRVQQDPGRDFLYESRRTIVSRQPLGNPALEPSTVISYQAAVKHVFDARWALQTAIFYRDLFGQIGARNERATPFATPQPRYENADEGHATGFEVTLLGSRGETRHLELDYTYMQALGTESYEEGSPFGPQRGARPPPIGEHPLSWDRRHSFTLSLLWQRPDAWSLGWTTVAGSGLPWTPSTLRTYDADWSEYNSRRFGWSESSALSARWTPPLPGRRLTLGLDVRNPFDERTDVAATVDGYPNPVINTLYDDYGAYRTATGHGGGAYWNDANGDGVPGWVPVGDARLVTAPRAVRLSLGASW